MGIFSCLRVVIISSFFFCVLLLSPGVGAAVDLFPIRFASPSWDMSLAYDINASGHVVGIYQAPGIARGFLYRSENVTDICPSGWSNCAASSISDNGTIGGSGTDGATVKGFVYSGGSYETVAPTGWSSTVVLAVNDSGQAAGYGVFGSTTMGFRHDGGSFVSFLPPGYTFMRAEDMNGSGDVVGYGVNGGVDKAFLYRNGVMSDPSPPGWTNTRAKDINDRGDIVGRGENGAIEMCFLRSGAGFSVILPPGWESSDCDDINGLGEIVGSGRDEEGQSRRFIYRKGRYHFVEGPLFISALSDGGLVAGAETLDFISLQAMAAYLLPEPDVQANGEDGLLAIDREQPLSIRAALAAFGFTGRPSDWWLFAQTPAGPYTFDVATRRWVPGFRPAAVMPLRDVGGAKLPPAGAGPGFYTYFLGADLVANGRVDVKYLVYDSVAVFIR